MKRRDFLLGTAGALGSSVPILAGASVRPCPPSPCCVSQGGTQLTANCSSLTPEQDWLARSTGAGVVWVHDFRSYSEIALFSDPASITNDSGVRLKNGRNQDPDRADPNTYETPSGYHNTFLLLPGETPKSGWPNTLPGVGSGAMIVEQPDAIAWNGYPKGTYFRWANATRNVQVVFPDGTVKPAPGQVYSNHSYHRFNTGSGWMRPLAPLTGATNGRGVDDPAANGTMPRYSYPIAVAARMQSSNGGPPRGAIGRIRRKIPATGAVLGNEFWLQMRIWVDPNQFAARLPVAAIHPGAGIGGEPCRAACEMGQSVQPVSRETDRVARSGQVADARPQYGTDRRMDSRCWGGDFDSSESAGAGGAQDVPALPLHEQRCRIPGDQLPVHSGPNTAYYQTNPAHSGGYHATCNSGQNIALANKCWEVPAGEWWTLMLHFKPGRTNIGYQPVAHRDTLVEIKVARWGETDWTHIFYDDAQPWWWNTSGSHPRGMSTLRLVNYRNEVPFWTRLAQAYTQVIFSTQEIPCPRAY